MSCQRINAHVAAAEFLMKFRTHQMCLWCTEFDNVLLQLETGSTHVTHVLLLQILFCSQLDDFTNGVERLAGTLEDVLESACDIADVLNVLH